jgi:hypothetical protein
LDVTRHKKRGENGIGIIYAVHQCGSKILSTYSCKRRFEERPMSYHEAVKEEITTIAKEEVFQDVIDDGSRLKVELLESCSLPLTNEEHGRVGQADL